MKNVKVEFEFALRVVDRNECKPNFFFKFSRKKFVIFGTIKDFWPPPPPLCCAPVYVHSNYFLFICTIFKGHLNYYELIVQINSIVQMNKRIFEMSMKQNCLNYRLFELLMGIHVQYSSNEQ